MTESNHEGQQHIEYPSDTLQQFDATLANVGASSQEAEYETYQARERLREYQATASPPSSIAVLRGSKAFLLNASQAFVDTEKLGLTTDIFEPKAKAQGVESRFPGIKVKFTKTHVRVHGRLEEVLQVDFQPSILFDVNKSTQKPLAPLDGPRPFPSYKRIR